MFEKEAEEYAKANMHYEIAKRENGANYAKEVNNVTIKQAYLAGAEFGYDKANEWHRVSDKLPEMDVFVYLWTKGKDFPVVACRHVPYGQKEWIWDCMWGSGYTMSQSKGEDYLWKEIVFPKEIKENDQRRT